VVTYRTAALDALGDRTRRSIFERLGRGGSCAVGELARELPVSRPAVSQHLMVLQQAGLMTHDAVGTRRIYRLDPAGIEGPRTYFEQFWTEALASFKEVAERLEEQHDDKEKQ
jgi:DNA-binding transcriptional ArsR family regulator